MSELKYWQRVFKSMRLNPEEKKEVSRFLKERRSRGFFAAAKILRTYHMMSECIELLRLGLSWYPGHYSARIVLAHLLLKQGMVEDSWRLLESSPSSLHNIFSAQKLRLTLAILFDDEDKAKDICLGMMQRNMCDPEVTDILSKISSLKFSILRDEIIAKFTAQGSHLILIPRPIVPVQINQKRMGAESIIYSKDDDFREKSKGFFVAPPREVFGSMDFDHSVSDGLSNFELESRADIFEMQGHFRKALSIYKRLALRSPNNELWRRKARDMQALLRQQRSTDLAINPQMVLQMKQIEMIDGKIDFLQRILDKLD